MKIINTPTEEWELLSHRKAREAIRNNLVIGCESEVSASYLCKYGCRRFQSVLYNLRPKQECFSKYQITNCLNCPELRESIQSQEWARNYFVECLKQTGGHYVFGEKGVSNIEGDGSVPNGVETKTVALPTIPEVIHKVYTDICLRELEVLSSTNQYTGLHYHVLAPGVHNVYSTPFSLGRYFLHNLMTLSAIALPVLAYWGMRETNKTRYAIFRLPYFNTEVMENSFLLENIDKQPPHQHPGKYLAITPYLSDNRDNKIARPHIEFRYADNVINPDYRLLHTILGVAIVIRAMDLEANEIISLQDDSLSLARELSVKIINMGNGERRGSVNLTSKDIAKIAKLHNTLLEILSNNIKELDPYGNLLEIFSNLSNRDNIPAYNSTINYTDIIRGFSTFEAKPVAKKVANRPTLNDFIEPPLRTIQLPATTRPVEIVEQDTDTDDVAEPEPDPFDLPPEENDWDEA